MTHKISTKSPELALDETFDKAYRQVLANRLSDAEDSYRRILDAYPEHPRALHALGAVSYRQGKREQAITLILRALELNPDFADAHNNLGNIYKDEGDLDKAAECYQAALTINEKHPLALNNLGIIYLDRKKPVEALDLFRSALALAPDYAEAYVHQGNALTDLGQIDEAANSYEKAIELKTEYALAHFNYGNALKKKGCMSDAVQRYRNALKIRPDYSEALMNLGNTLMSQGLLEEAIVQYRKALEIEPENFGVHSNIIFCLNYLPDITEEEIFNESLCWAEIHEKPRSANIIPLKNDRTSIRRLRVGYVSPDFRVHSVSYFCEPLFSAHDRQRFELFCYGDVARPDMTTARLKKLADVWVDTVGMTDQELAARIRSDRIDILVDLAGHTAKNRLTVFAEKPAPVQVTWLGYPGTTGLSTMDYRITDTIADPSDVSRHHSETLLRLADGFLCYEPPKDAPPVTPLPLAKNPGITFGSFNNPAKITPAVLDTWVLLLETIPLSRLILKSHSFSDKATRLIYMKPFQNRGIDPLRIELLPAENRTRDHLALYGRIDVSLDPFPYNGTTTTCESLWMGVPVISLYGTRHAARVGASILSRVGLEKLIAHDTQEYIRIAAYLASDPSNLSRLRNSLRHQVSRSKLCNRESFARQVETAYQKAWDHWATSGTRFKPEEIRND